MEARTVLLIGIPVIFGLAVLLVVATTISRERVATGSLGREARRADRSPLGDTARPDPDEEARTRFAAAKAGLEPAGLSPVRAVGPLIRFQAPGDPETLGVTRRQFFNRGILTAQSLVLGSFGMAVVAFLWPARGGGFGARCGPGRSMTSSTRSGRRGSPSTCPRRGATSCPIPRRPCQRQRMSTPRPSFPAWKRAWWRCSRSVLTWAAGCRGAPLHQWFECPCHGSKYNRVGEKKGGPAPRGMDRFPVDVSGGVMTINTAIVVQGPAIGTNTTGQEAEGPNCV